MSVELGLAGSPVTGKRYSPHQILVCPLIKESSLVAKNDTHVLFMSIERSVTLGMRGEIHVCFIGEVVIEVCSKLQTQP